MEHKIDEIVRQLTVVVAQLIFAKKQNEPVEQFQAEIAFRVLEQSGIIDELLQLKG